MAEKIKLTPSELLAQAAEMKSLEAEYNTLFSEVSAELNKMNSNWSSNLAHNFAGKITSSAKIFSQITQELLNGAKVAENSAVTFETVDSQLAKVYTDVVAAAESVFSSIGSGVINGASSLPEDIKSAGEVLAYLEKQYGELPDFVKDMIKSVCPDDLEQAYKLTSDLLQGKFSIDNVYDILDFIGDGSTEIDVLIRSLKYAFDKGAIRDEKMMQDVINQLKEGDVLGAIFDGIEGFTDIIIGGAIEVGADMIGNTVDSIIGNIPVIGGIAEGIESLTGGHSIGDYISDAGGWISDGLDAATDVISDGVNYVTDGITSGVQAVTGFFGSLF